MSALCGAYRLTITDTEAIGTQAARALLNTF